MKMSTNGTPCERRIWSRLVLWSGLKSSFDRSVITSSRGTCSAKLCWQLDICGYLRLPDIQRSYLACVTDPCLLYCGYRGISWWIVIKSSVWYFLQIVQDNKYEFDCHFPVDPWWFVGCSGTTINAPTDRRTMFMLGGGQTPSCCIRRRRSRYCHIRQPKGFSL